jgi:hypothetical protein
VNLLEDIAVRKLIPGRIDSTSRHDAEWIRRLKSNGNSSRCRSRLLCTEKYLQDGFYKVSQKLRSCKKSIIQSNLKTFQTDLRDLVQIQNTILEERLEMSVASSPWSPNHGRTKIKKEKPQKLPRRNHLREEELRVKKTQTNKQTLTLLFQKLASYSYRQMMLKTKSESKQNC